MVCIRHGHPSSQVLATFDIAPFSGRGFGQNELFVRTNEGVMSAGIWLPAWVKCPTWVVREIEGVTCLAGVVNTSVSLQGALLAEIRIRINLVKVWNAAGNWMVAICCRGSLKRLISLRWCGDGPNNPHSKIESAGAC